MRIKSSTLIKDKVYLISEPDSIVLKNLLREGLPHLETAPAMYIDALRAPKAFR